MLSLSVKCSLIIFLIIFFNVYKIKLSVLFYMRMPLKIFCENLISNQFPNILEALTLIIFQLKPALLFYASNPFNFVLKKKINKSCSYQPWKERKFIIFESKLLELFQFCPSCSAHALFDVKRILGSMIKVEQTCGSCGFNRIWESQPMIGSVPAGNLIFSAALLLTGKIYI